MRISHSQGPAEQQHEVLKQRMRVHCALLHSNTYMNNAYEGVAQGDEEQTCDAAGRKSSHVLTTLEYWQKA